MSRGKHLRMMILPLLSILALLIAACGSSQGTSSSSNNQPAPDSKQIVRIAVGATDFGSLDPALVQLAVDYDTLSTVFTGLVQFDNQVHLQNQLAASHSVSSDGLTYTFTLRPNLKFSDGTPLTSKDVAYSINRSLLPATKSQVAYYLNLIKDYDKITTGKIKTIIGDSVLTPDDNTVKIILSKPGAYFLQALTYPTSFVVEKSLIDKYGTNWTDHLDQGGGAGPYKVTRYDHTKGLYLVPNPNYYGKPPKVKQLQFLISGDQDTTFNSYQAHQYDTTGVVGVPPTKVTSVRSSADFHEYTNLRIRYLTMNYLVKPFDNIKVRQALALAVDKDLLAKTVFRNTVAPSNHIVPQGMDGYNSALKGPAGVASTAGDKTMAKQLLQQGLQEDGLTSFPTNITFSYYTDSKAIVVASQAVLQMWQQVLGINMKSDATTYAKLITLENATVNNPKGLQVWISGWLADYPDPQDWLTTFFDKGSGYNQMNYGQNQSKVATQQQTIQKQLEQADVTQDQATRLKMYNDAEQSIINDVGWLPIYQNKIQVMQSPKLHGIVFNALSITPPDDWANIYISQ